MAGTGDDQRDTSWTDDISHDAQRSRTRGSTANVSGWSDRTSAGLRDRVDKEEAAWVAQRTRQTQHVTRQSEVVHQFDHVQFVAHITDNIKFNRNGDMMVTIQVPYQFKHLAMPLTDAFGIPLSFDVEIWVPYAEATEAEA